MIKLFKAKSLKKTREKERGRENKNAKKQKGRSMVEMLGVLAIIGVLSIGGIQGYTMAMRRYRANEIINIANKYALIIYSSCQTVMEKNPEKYYINSNSSGGWWAEGTDMYEWRCPRIDFSNSGIGSLPSELVEILGAEILTTPRGHVVEVILTFKSRELCHTLLSITGGAHSYSDDVENAEIAQILREAGKKHCSTDDTPSATIDFVMN